MLSMSYCSIYDSEKKMLTLEQKVFIVQCYGLGENISYSYVTRMFNEKWPNLTINRISVKSIVSKFRRTGSVLNIKKKKTPINEEENVGATLALDSVRHFPKTSLRIRASHIGNISKSYLQIIFKANKVRPYKPKFVHTLEANDDAKRLDFCLWVGQKYLQNRNFFHNIIFSDEATFSTNGVVSSQNLRYWSTENPHFRIHCRRQYSKKVNVWCAVTYNGIIGPYFFEANMNQHSYLEMLNTIFFHYLNNMPLIDRRTTYFQQDGHPAHSTVIVREWLNRQFPERWIGRYGPIPWPPRSPDLTIMDFYLWGYLTQKVYASHLEPDLDNLKIRITEAIQAIPLQEIRNAYKAFIKKVQRCEEVGGETFE